MQKIEKDNGSSDATHAWENLRLGQIRRLVKLREYGKWSQEVEQINSSTLSRDLDKIAERFGIGDLVLRQSGEKTLSPTGEMLAQAFQPALDFCERLGNGEILGSGKERCFRIGSGGSLASWLVGSRLDKIRASFRHDPQADSEPKARSRIEVEVYRNRATVVSVTAGALDCGLVRKGVIADHRYRLRKEKIGTILYYLYVPESFFPENLLGHEEGQELPDYLEKKILETCPVATVGPDGEFRVRLDEALNDRGVNANIEIQYRAFPMLIPHMMRGSHVVIMPDIKSLGGIEPPYYKKFKLAALSDYKREIFLIMHPRHEERMSWVSFDKLAEALRFRCADD